MTHIMIVGDGFDAEERARIRALAPVVEVSGPDAIGTCDAQARNAVCAVAYKGHAPFDAQAMEALPALGLIANFGVGYDAIDVGAASERGIAVTNTPDVLNDDVADLTVGLMLGWARQMVQGHDLVASGEWGKRGLPLARKLSGASVGIVGLGRIGREIADRLAAFKMDIHYTSRSQKDTPGWEYHSSVADMAAKVDWLVIALVGGPDTVNHVDRRALTALGPDGVVVNISRGTTVDEAAMLDLLESGGLAGAALDVFLNEPQIDARFLGLSNVLLQPHQGSATVATRRAMSELQCANIAAFLAGEPLLTPVG
ncbi:2-hydroxyacid dehydrogenase [Sagittula sp. SSi028]|uniref:2-hydroxyacid dehydrogenase n=1 Tax=Sagittula sp. SSi028 TaxID=3400636 RepID=UPI003AF9A1CD